jgi:hypothetical protein
LDGSDFDLNQPELLLSDGPCAVHILTLKRINPALFVAAAIVAFVLLRWTFVVSAALVLSAGH